ncbi:chemotaxis protein CheW [Xanthomonas sp. 60]
MNREDVLDDYLVELLGPVQAAPVGAPATADASAAVLAHDAPGACGEAREPTWDDLPDEVIYETGPATLAADVAIAVADDAELQAAFDAVASAEIADAHAAAPAREPTWDDLPDEVIYESGPATLAADVAIAVADDAALQAAFDAVAGVGIADAAGQPGANAAATPEPTWDDLPDEVIYETDPDASAVLTNADSPHLEAAFAAAAEVPADTPPPAPSTRLPRLAPAAPAIAPAFQAPFAARAQPAAPADGSARPASWHELQAQQPASSPNANRRATERTTRWLRLRCGPQAYALELLKVQEVVLPVPLLPLRGTRPEMLGIMNLRGQVVPVMDLGIHLGAQAAADDSLARIVVLEENGDIMGLRVSAVEDVTNLSESQIEPPDTARICRISNDIFRGVARLQQQPMILLDATRLLN